jgi:hypothetical protein
VRPAPFVVALPLFVAACQGTGSAPVSYGRHDTVADRIEARTTSPCLSSTCMYVVDEKTSRRSSYSRVLIFPADSTGNTSPVQAIEGRKAGLYLSRGIAVDDARNLYLTSGTSGTVGGNVVVYPAGATGDASPLYKIVGSDTGLADSVGVALDQAGEIFVANEIGGPNKAGSITVYAAGADGDASPIRTISGSNSELSTPTAIALDPSGRIYVLNVGDVPSVTVFAAGATGNVAPVQLVTSSGLANPQGLTVDAVGDFFVTGQLSGAQYVNVFAATANGYVQPTRSITGSKTKMNAVSGIGLDPAGNTYVTNSDSARAGSNVTVYSADASGNAKPIQFLRGRQTKLRNAFGMTVR